MTEQTDVSAYARKLFVNDTAVQNLGIAVEATGPGTAVARFEVTTAMLNGFGVCHGGHLFALADTAFAYACNTYGNVTVAAGASIEFLQPAYAGDHLTATAVERRRGGRTGVYDVSVRNGAGEEVAVFRGRSHATRKPILDADADQT